MQTNPGFAKIQFSKPALAPVPKLHSLCQSGKEGALANPSRVTMDAQSLNAPVLESLNLPWHRLLNQGTRLHAPAQAWLNLPTPCVDFYYLASGRIIVLHADAEGRERAMFRLNPGNLFNEAPAAAGFDIPNSPFLSERDCVYYRFSNALLHDPAFVSANPDLIINLMTGLGIKVLIHHTSLSNFTGLPAVMRLSRFFLSLASRQESLNLDPAMTQEAMATLLGMNRATMVRALRVLKEQGAILRSTKHLLVINDLDKLRQLAGN